MKIFLTGGTGFIGKNLQDLIIENDHDLLILSRKKRSSKKKLRFIKGDIDLSIKNIGIIKKFEPQIIINLAWENIPNYDKKSIHKNLNKHINFIKKIKFFNSVEKIIMSGTCLEYQNMKAPYKESKKFIPSSFFPKAKIRLRKYLFSKIKEKQIIWPILFYVYGKGQRTKSLIPFTKNKILNNKNLMINNLYQKNDYIHVKDVVEILYKIMIEKKTISGVFNIGSGKLTSNKKIIELIKKKFNKKFNKLFFKNEETNVQKLIANIDKVKKIYNWKPKISVTDAIQKSWI